MKIVYLTDIHDALRELRVVLHSTQADLYLLSGDILYKAFYQEEKIYQFVCLQEEFWAFARERDLDWVPFDIAADILRFPDRYGSEDLIIKAAEYRLLYNKAARTMKEKYNLIEEIIRKYGNAECRVLPGNYDLDLRYTALASRDLHHKSMTFQGIKFAGYGGAPIATPGIPQKLAVAYHEKSENGKLFSEPEDFFNEVEPEVLVLHQPAYGFFDTIPGQGHVGSLGVRNYIDNHSPALVLSGHVHEDYGIIVKRNGTVLLNPSNFGGVDSLMGWQKGGTFAEIYLEDKRVRQVNLMLMADHRVQPIMEIDVEDPGNAKIHEQARESCPLELPLFVRDVSGAHVR